jgi:methylthioribose-1-phosphate isomerase
LGLRANATDHGVQGAYETLLATRPTAINLRWALDRVKARISSLPETLRAQAAWDEAGRICEDDVAANAAIGRHGLRLFRESLEAKSGTEKVLNVMTHCNAGWLGCVDWGTAISPIYQAHDAGLRVHAWVSETRPRNQGAALTAWELRQHGIPCTLVVDNEAGHLIQRGFVDLCIVGTDRVAANGDVANKIGTYLKALAAKAHRIPFYVAAPVSSIDWTIRNGVRDIPIEQRSGREVTHMAGRTAAGGREEVLITPEGTAARNDGFDVTPAKLVSGLITEHGVVPAKTAGLRQLKAQLAEGHHTQAPALGR